jgi:hypothetical protein
VPHVLLRRHYNKCIPSLSAAMSYLNVSKPNLPFATESPNNSEEAAASGHHCVEES